MKLFLLTQNVYAENHYYDSAVVAANTEQEAKEIHPNGGSIYQDRSGSWAEHPRQVRAIFLGFAKSNSRKRVICASFNQEVNKALKEQWLDDDESELNDGFLDKEEGIV